MKVEQVVKNRQIKALIEKYPEYKKTGLGKLEQDLNKEKSKILIKLRDRLIEDYNIKEVNTKEKYLIVRNAAWNILEDSENEINKMFYLDSYEKKEILELLLQTMFGYGILDPLISDPNITEIMVNGTEKIFIEKKGKIERAKNKRGEDLRFNTQDELKCVIEKIVAPINRKVDETNPIVDARLPNGFRVNISLSPISLDGHALTIRKFPENPYKMEDLIKFNTITIEAAFFLKCLVEAKYNILVSGGTGSGKTTFLNALSNFIRKDERVVTIEDSAELKISNVDNLIRLESRQPNIEGKGEITIRDLLKSALRMRPDRIIVGEVYR